MDNVWDFNKTLENWRNVQGLVSKPLFICPFDWHFLVCSTNLKIVSKINWFQVWLFSCLFNLMLPIVCLATSLETKEWYLQIPTKMHENKVRIVLGFSVPWLSMLFVCLPALGLLVNIDNLIYPVNLKKIPRIQTKITAKDLFIARFNFYFLTYFTLVV